MTFKEYILTKYHKTYKNLNGKRSATLISIEQILFEYDKFEQLHKHDVGRSLPDDKKLIDFAWWFHKNIGQFSDDETAHFDGEYLKMWKGQ